MAQKLQLQVALKPWPPSQATRLKQRRGTSSVKLAKEKSLSHLIAPSMNRSD